MVNRRKEVKKRFFYPDEFEKMLDVLNKNQRHTATCLINTGARIEEMRNVEKTDIDGDRKNLILRKTKVRARLGEREPEPRVIAISNKFWRYLISQIKLRRILSTNAFNISIKDAAKEVKIKLSHQFSSHNLRKTFGTWMLALGVDGFKLAQHLGHTPNELARDYATNDVFNHRDKQIMRSILGNLPDRF